MTLAEASRLASLARRAQQAAYDLARSPLGSTLPLSGIPVNPWLFYGEPQGRRYEHKVAVEYTVPGETRPIWRTAFVESGRLLTRQDVMLAAYDYFIDETVEYDLFDFGRVPTAADVTYHIESIMRRF